MEPFSTARHELHPHITDYSDVDAPLRILVTDGDSTQRAALTAALKSAGNVVIVGGTGGIAATVQAVDSLRPDIVCLDTEFGGGEGLRLLRILAASASTDLLVVTENTGHAVEAFEAGAVDFLLKPADPERMARALERYAQRRRDADARNGQPLTLVETGADRSSDGQLDRFVIRNAGRIYAITCADVDWIESSGNYVRLHEGSRVHIYRATLNELGSRLPAGAFSRIHRSTLVNVKRITEIRSNAKGSLAVVLADGTELPVSRRNRSNLQSLLKSGF